MYVTSVMSNIHIFIHTQYEDVGIEAWNEDGRMDRWMHERQES